MSLVDKITSGAKKGFDWFTFNDGLGVQQKYFGQACDVDSFMLQGKVLATTGMYFLACAVIPAITYSALIRYAFTNPNMNSQQAYLGFFIVMGIEKARAHIRFHFLENHHEIFASQVEKALKNVQLPEQILSIDGPEPSSFERDPDYWKKSE